MNKNKNQPAKQKVHFSLEQGGLADLLGSVFLLVFVFSLLAAYISYSGLIEKKLKIDNIAKTYLYDMEEFGYLRPEAKTAMENDLANIGVSISVNQTITNSDGSTTTTQGWNKMSAYMGETNQVDYGDSVFLICDVQFEYNAVNAIANLSKTYYYTINMRATSKW